jgi:ankyrin repeat protein
MRLDDELWEAIYAQDFDAVKVALDDGADVNNQNNDEGITPLMAASVEGNLETVKLLIEHGAKVNHMAHGNNALISAAGAGRRQVYEYLLPLVSKKIRATVAEADLATGEKLRARVADPHSDEFVMAAARGNSKK